MSSANLTKATDSLPPPPSHLVLDMRGRPEEAAVAAAAVVRCFGARKGFYGVPIGEAQDA